MMPIREAIEILKKERGYAEVCRDHQALEAYDVAFKAFEDQETLTDLRLQVMDVLFDLDRGSLTAYQLGKRDAYQQVLDAIKEGEKE